MEAPADLSRAMGLWARVDLSAERHEALDGQALSIADNQQDSAVGREALKEVIRDFKGTPLEERLRRVGPVIKAFQAEVDALTRRQAFAEDSFLSLYRSLADAPDLAGSLAAAEAELRHARAAEAELPGLRTKLALLEEEFGSLKNQEHTIRRLQQQIKENEASSRGDASAAAALFDATERWERERAALVATAAHANAEASRAVSKAQEEARVASRARAAAEEEVEEMRAAHGVEMAEAEAEAEALRGQVDSLSARLQRGASAGAAESWGGRDGSCIGAAAGAAEFRSLESELRLALERVSVLEANLGERERALAAHAMSAATHTMATAALEARIAGLEAELARAEQPGKGSTAPSAEACATSLQAFSRAAAPPAPAAPAAPPAASFRMDALQEEARRLSSDLTVSRGLLASAEAALEESRAAEAVAARRAAEQALLLSRLEDELVAARAARCPSLDTSLNTSVDASSPAALAAALGPSPLDAAELGAAPSFLTPVQPPSPPASVGDAGAMLKLMVSQRDRARREAAAMAAEAGGVRERLRAAQVAARKYHEDSLDLYEKIRYLESTARECAPLSLSRAGSSSPLLGGAPEGTGSGIGGRGEACRGCTTSTSTEAAYAREYEARISPFNAFRRRERQARYNELSPVEKILFAVASVVLAHRRARIGLFVYILLLHLMVFGTTVHHALVHSVAQRHIERHTLA